MNYQETLEYLFSKLPMFHRTGGQAYKANLENTIALCKHLGDPQIFFRSIHVAGTNGKGSVSHILASILQTAGYRTGLYTSPHMKDFRERIRVNGKKIQQGSVTGFVKKHQAVIEQIQPSFFELTVAMAFDYFKKQQVDIAIIEVGMGGRLDSTNIIHPILSIITNVSLDHVQFLGDTVEKIALEKAGIIKPGIPVIVGETDRATKEIFSSVAGDNRSDIFFADQLFSIEHDSLTGVFQHKRKFDINKGYSSFIRGLTLPLGGDYQRKNILTVMAACDQLQQYGYKLPPEVLLKGSAEVIRNTGFQGRWQIIGTDPLTICDTGHNESGIREVFQQVRQTPHRNLHIVFGMVNDKDTSVILSLLPRDAQYYFCQPAIPRGLDSFILEFEAHKIGLTGARYPSVNDALDAARKKAEFSDLVLVCGSTFVVAEVVR